MKVWLTYPYADGNVHEYELVAFGNESDGNPFVRYCTGALICTDCGPEVIEGKYYHSTKESALSRGAEIRAQKTAAAEADVARLKSLPPVTVIPCYPRLSSAWDRVAPAIEGLAAVIALCGMALAFIP